MRHDFATSLAWAIVTGIMVASSYGLNSVGFSMQRLAQIPMATWCNEAVNSYLYHQEPKELENSDTGDQARQARDAIDSGSLTLQAFSLLSLASSAIVCISLTVTIWRSSWVSAVLVLLSLFPSVIEYMIFADVEQTQWPKIMKVSRRARYFEDILLMKSQRWSWPMMMLEDMSPVWLPKVTVGGRGCPAAWNWLIYSWLWRPRP